jgi:hypothetical protein
MKAESWAVHLAAWKADWKVVELVANWAGKTAVMMVALKVENSAERWDQLRNISKQFSETIFKLRYQNSNTNRYTNWLRTWL